MSSLCASPAQKFSVRPSSHGHFGKCFHGYPSCINRKISSPHRYHQQLFGGQRGAVGDLTNCHRSITILDNRRINYSSRNVLEKKIAWFVIYPKLSVIGMYVFMASIFFLIPPGLMIFLY